MPSGDNPNSRKNLKPFTKDRQPSKEQVEKAGKTRSKTVSQKKTLREALEILLEKEYTNAKGENMSGTEAIALSLLDDALSGRNKPKAFEVIRDTIGQKPVEKVVVADVDASVIAEVEELVNGNDKKASS